MKKIVTILFCILLLFGVLGAIISNVINWNEYRPQIAKIISDKIDQKVEISGDVKLEFLPIPHISMLGIHILTPDNEHEIIEIKSLNVYFAPKSLLAGVLKISDIQIESPTVFAKGGQEYISTLEKRLNFKVKNITQPSSFIQFNKLSVRNGVFQDGENILAKNIELDLNFETIKGPFQLNGGFKYQNKDLKIDLSTGQFSSNVAPIELNILTNVGDIKLNGTMGVDNGFYIKGKLSSLAFQPEIFLTDNAKISKNMSSATSFSGSMVLTKNDLYLDDFKLSNNNIKGLFGSVKLNNYGQQKETNLIMDVVAEQIDFDSVQNLPIKNLKSHIKLKAKNFIYKKSYFENIDLDMRQNDGDWQITQFVSNINKTTKIEAVGRIGTNNKTYDLNVNLYTASIEDIYKSRLGDRFDKNILNILKTYKDNFQETRFVFGLKNIKNGYQLSNIYMSFDDGKKNIKGDIKYRKNKGKGNYDISASIGLLNLNGTIKKFTYADLAKFSKKKNLSFDFKIDELKLDKEHNFKDITLKASLADKVISIEQAYLKNANDNSELWADGHFELSQPMSNVDFQLRLKNGKTASLFQLLNVDYPSYVDGWKNDETSIVFQGGDKDWTVSTDIKTDTTSLQLSGDIKNYNTDAESYKSNMRIQQKDVSNIWSFFDVPKGNRLDLKGDLDFYAEISKDKNVFEFKNIQSLIDQRSITGGVKVTVNQTGEKEIKYDVKADLETSYLNITNIKAQDFFDKSTSKLRAMDLALKADMFVFQSANIKNMQAKLLYSPSKIELKKLTGKSHGEDLTASGYLKKNKAIWNAKADIKASKLPSKMLSNFFDVAGIKLGSFIDLDMSVTGSGKNIASISSNLSGYSNIKTQNGSVVHMDIASIPVALSKLNGVTNDLKNKLSNELKANKANYETMFLNVDFKDGKALLRDSYFLVGEQKLNLTGAVYIAKNIYNLTFNTIYKTSKDSLYGDLPALNVSRDLEKGETHYQDEIETKKIRDYLSRKFSIYMKNKFEEEEVEEAKEEIEIKEESIQEENPELEFEVIDYGDDIEAESLGDIKIEPENKVEEPARSEEMPPIETMKSIKDEILKETE